MNAKLSTLPQNCYMESLLPSIRSSRSVFLSCPWLNVLVYLAVCLVLLLKILHRLHGHFSYCVDDAYIHLALSERIAHGLYGINAGEPSSPASSILWPFLFVPFVGTRILLYLPLVFNLVAGSCTAWLLGRVVEKGIAVKGIAETEPQSWRPQALSILLLFAVNIFGLTFLGLEHPLEALLAVSSAYGLLYLLADAPPPLWTLVAAGMLPSVRYEGLLITTAVVIALWGVGRRRCAAILLPVSIVPIVAFGLFLHHLGLPFAPMSVLMKSPTAYLGGSRLAILLRLAKGSFLLHLHDPERFSILILAVTLGYLACRYFRVQSIRSVAGAGAFACVVHMMIGPYGWFYRYEIYCLSFALVLTVGFGLKGRVSPGPEPNLSKEPVLWSVHGSETVPGGMLVAVATLALFYLSSVLAVEQTASAIYEQQAQLGRFTRDFYTGPIAVHDLGWIGVGRNQHQYVLDLAGLGSYEAFRLHNKLSRQTFAAMAQEHGIGLAILNPSWFAGSVPSSWQPMAKLCAIDPADDYSLVSNRVVFYATPLADRAALVERLRAFQQVLPAYIPFELNPVSVSTSCAATSDAKPDTRS